MPRYGATKNHGSRRPARPNNSGVVRTHESRRRGSRNDPTQVTLDLYLHAGQRAIRASRARFRVVACGRQWGKTRLGVPYAFSRALEGARGFWCAPDYKRAQIGWRILKMLAEQLPFVAIREGDRRIETPNGGWVEVRSGHVEGQLRAETLDFVVVDEAAYMPEERWTKELRPTLAVTKGEAIFLSTFDGENWFYGLYERGLSDEFPQYESWRHPSIDNPYIDSEEVEEARRTTPRPEFEQEWNANPLVYAGAVFDGEDVFRAQERGLVVPERSQFELDALEHFGAIDWGYTNPTAFLINEETPATGYVRWLAERLWVAMPLGPDPTGHTDTRIDRIVRLCRQYNILAIYCDAEDPNANATLYDTLERAGLSTEVVSVPFGKWKMTGITTRRWYLERGLEAMTPDCPELLRTTKKYRWKEGKEDKDVEKKDDHPVDAATAFYASRRSTLLGA